MKAIYQAESGNRKSWIKGEAKGGSTPQTTTATAAERQRKRYR